MAKPKLFWIFIIGSIFVILLQQDCLKLNTIHFYQNKDNLNSGLLKDEISSENLKTNPKIHVDTLKEKRNEKLKYLSKRYNPLRHLPIYDSQNVSRVFLVAYFRSGSSFLGDLLQQNWKSFYSFEPLHYMTRQMKIEGSTNTSEAFKLIRDIFNCTFEDSENYITWVNKNIYLLKWNKFLWSVSRFREPTFDQNSLHEACIRSKYNIIKSVRLKLEHVEPLHELLKDLNVKFIYLVRDPRGMYNSRKNMEWCNKEKVCYDIASICEEMGNDLENYDRIKKVIGEDKLILLKYEDLASDPLVQTKSLLSKLEMPYSSSVSRFLRTHTKSHYHNNENKNPYSTYRHNSSITANQWMKELNATEIETAQINCRTILERFNYPFV